MASLELECPNCEQTLELDSGFAGGVCRCSNCGTLMTVPADPRQQAERLVRPDAPGGDRPESPTSGRPESPTAAPTPAGGPETYTTASGRTIEISSGTSIPTAQKKRPMVRAVTAAVVGLLMLVVVGAMIFAIAMLVREPAGVDAEQVAIEQFGYDPTVNPFTLEAPNLLGLPLRDRVAIVVDASGQGRNWLGLVKDAAVAGLSGRGGGASVGLIYATEPDPVALSEEPVPVSELTEERLRSFQSEIVPAGVAPLDAAVKRAMQWNPSQVILVTGQPLSRGEVQTLSEAVAQQASVAVDVVTVGQDVAALEDLAAQHGGRYVQLSQGQLIDWYRDAETATGP